MTNTKTTFEGLMMAKIESDHREKNPNEDMAKISFRIPQGGLNVLDYMAKKLDSSRQDILNEILKDEIRNAFIGMTAHLELSEEKWAELFESVCKGEKVGEHNA
jgi:hypothetical protein